MLDIEVIGIEAVASRGPTAVEVEELCALALSSADIDEGHAAVEFVDSWARSLIWVAFGYGVWSAFSGTNEAGRANL